MNISFSKIEELLPRYLSGGLSDKDRAMIEDWRKKSPDNEKLYKETVSAWEATTLLQEMEQFNSFEALKKINTKLSKEGHAGFGIIIQRVAAILLLPLLVYTAYLTMQNKTKDNQQQQVTLQTVSSRPGMVTQFALADGTKVWLNSGSELQYPSRFTSGFREVTLKGEAFFEVTKDKHQPFHVNAGDLKIEVMGTSFNVASFEDDSRSEVVLVEGKVLLSSYKNQVKKEFGSIRPGQRVLYDREKQKVCSEDVQVAKYISWREGTLIFCDDSMEEVVKRLSRWFNVEITINDPEIKKYIYKATFKDESLIQVLNLLKLSAPIDYRITNRRVLPGENFTKQKVFIMKRKS